MRHLRCCVLIPTYNNEKSLARVIQDVLAYTQQVIVVNDGATDSTPEILKEFPEVEQLHFAKNRGKGSALKAGFKKAMESGYQFAITMDSDGQHFAQDIPVFLNALEREASKNVLYIGARNMKQADVPGKSSFGNKFSNFWFWFETGTWLEDTQCGYRLYPLKEIEKLSLYTPKFEFEIEVIVKAAWQGTLIKNIPIKILYEDVNRVSHFRTVPDFTRISILNTWLVLVSLFYVKPRDLYRKIKKKGFKQFFLNDVLGSNDTPQKKSASMALGVFVGLSPFWGLHTFLVLFLSIVLKLNKPIAFAFSNVSLPPFIPFIVLASLQIGSWIFGESLSFSLDGINRNFDFLVHLKAYLLGSMVLATVSALLVGSVGYLILSFFGKRKMAMKNG